MLSFDVLSEVSRKDLRYIVELCFLDQVKDDGRFLC